jgi:hypothetical protein
MEWLLAVDEVKKMGFKISEGSSITATSFNEKGEKDGKYSKEHKELNDAMESAINWLADKPEGTKILIMECTWVQKVK